MRFKTGKQLVKRLRTVQEAKEEFWDRWIKKVFPSPLKQMKLFKTSGTYRWERLCSERMRQQHCHVVKVHKVHGLDGSICGY